MALLLLLLLFAQKPPQGPRRGCVGTCGSITSKRNVWLKLPARACGVCIVALLCAICSCCDRGDGVLCLDQQQLPTLTSSSVKHQLLHHQQQPHISGWW
jgi:hypothetical protein